MNPYTVRAAKARATVRDLERFRDGLSAVIGRGKQEIAELDAAAAAHERGEPVGPVKSMASEALAPEVDHVQP